MAEFNHNLWAPWRMEYIRSMDSPAGEGHCFLCRYWAEPAEDRRNHVIWRKPSAFVVMNRFPYTNGHLLVAHSRHRSNFTDLNDEELAEMSRLLRDVVDLLQVEIKAQGFNVGYNLGQCAGAGLPGHVHAHVVPRWAGDTNYMAVLGDTRIIPDSLDALYDELAKAAVRRGFRSS